MAERRVFGRLPDGAPVEEVTIAAGDLTREDHHPGRDRQGRPARRRRTSAGARLRRPRQLPPPFALFRRRGRPLRQPHRPWPLHPRRPGPPARRQRAGAYPAPRRPGRLRPRATGGSWRLDAGQRHPRPHQPGRRPGLSRRGRGDVPLHDRGALHAPLRRRGDRPTRRRSSTSPSTAISTSTARTTSSTTASGSMPTPIRRPTTTSSPPARSARWTAPASTAGRWLRSA